MQGALERTHDNQYHLYNVDGFANTITDGAKVTAQLCPKPLQARCNVLAHRPKAHKQLSFQARGLHSIS